MKKKAFLILFTILVFMISGCQPTPDQKIVIGKNDELDSKLQETVEEDQFLNEPSNEKYWEETLVKKNITVIGDAKYTAPQSAKFPVYRAIPVFFSEDQAHEIVNKIWGDSEYYCDNEKTITKSEVEKDIVQYREILNYWENELKQKDSDYTAEEIQKQISEYQILIRQLESDYQNELPGEDQTHLEKNFSYQDQGDGLGNVLDLISEIDGIKEDLIIRQGNDDVSAEVFYYRHVNLLGEKGKQIDRKKSLIQAENFLKKLELEDIVSDGETVDCDDFGNEITYSFQFAIQREGIVLRNIHSARPTDSSGVKYALERKPERILISATENEVILFTWENPYEIVECVNQNVEVLSVQNALDLFRERIFQQVWCENDAEMTLEVINIELNYTWIQEKDRDTYLLIPVWDFLGYCYSAEEVREELAQETLYNDYAILSINAINGSNIYRG